MLWEEIVEMYNRVTLVVDPSVRLVIIPRVLSVPDAIEVHQRRGYPHL